MGLNQDCKNPKCKNPKCNNLKCKIGNSRIRFAKSEMQNLKLKNPK